MPYEDDGAVYEPGEAGYAPGGGLSGVATTTGLIGVAAVGTTGLIGVAADEPDPEGGVDGDVVASRG